MPATRLSRHIRPHAGDSPDPSEILFWNSSSSSSSIKRPDLRTPTLDRETRRTPVGQPQTNDRLIHSVLSERYHRTVDRGLHPHASYDTRYSPNRINKPYDRPRDSRYDSASSNTVVMRSSDYDRLIHDLDQEITKRSKSEMRFSTFFDECKEKEAQWRSKLEREREDKLLLQEKYNLVTAAHASLKEVLRNTRSDLDRRDASIDDLRDRLERTRLDGMIQLRDAQNRVDKYDYASPPVFNINVNPSIHSNLTNTHSRPETIQPDLTTFPALPSSISLPSASQPELPTHYPTTVPSSSPSPPSPKSHSASPLTQSSSPILPLPAPPSPSPPPAPPASSTTAHDTGVKWAGRTAQPKASTSESNFRFGLDFTQLVAKAKLVKTKHDSKDERALEAEWQRKFDAHRVEKKQREEEELRAKAKKALAQVMAERKEKKRLAEMLDQKKREMKSSGKLDMTPVVLSDKDGGSSDEVKDGCSLDSVREEALAKDEGLSDEPKDGQPLDKVENGAAIKKVVTNAAPGHLSPTVLPDHAVVAEEPSLVDQKDVCPGWKIPEDDHTTIVSTPVVPPGETQSDGSKIYVSKRRSGLDCSPNGVSQEMDHLTPRTSLDFDVNSTINVPRQVVMPTYLSVPSVSEPENEKTETGSHRLDKA